MVQAALELTKEPIKSGIEGIISVPEDKDVSNVAYMRNHKAKISKKRNFLKNCMGNSM